MFNRNKHYSVLPFYLQLPPSCATTEWSDWSTCSATCGSGVIIRIRSFKEVNPPEVCKEQVPLDEKVKCSGLAKCEFTGSVAKSKKVLYYFMIERVK